MKPTSAANFSLPREIPASVKRAVLLHNPPVIAMLIFFVVGIILAVTVGTGIDYKSVFVFKGNEPVTQGVITFARETSNSEGKGSARKDVWEYDFKYTVNGKAYSGKSYHLSPVQQTGDTVDVEYVANDPSTARIRGMRTAPHPIGAAVIFIVPLFSIFMLLQLYPRARRQLQLIRNGLLTYGKVISKEETSKRINKRKVYRLLVEFDAEGTKQQATVETIYPERVSDGQEKPLLYDPANPGRTQLVDLMSKKVRAFLGV